jgi:DNA modification methylase
MNHLFYGDNLEVLRQSVATESVDLIYLDPPFNSQANYNILFKAPSGENSQAQIEAFEDTWHWNRSAEQAFDEIMTGGNSDAAELLRALRLSLRENDMMAYLTMMAVRILELRRVLKQNGSLYLHCDPTASHYVKIIMDGIFGARNFRSEIVWKRSSSHNRAKRWGPVHDNILFYTASENYCWNRTFSSYGDNYLSGKYRHEDEQGRRYRLSDLTGPGTRAGDSGAEWRGVNPTNYGRHWEPPHDRALPEWFQFPDGWSELPVRARLEALHEAGLIRWPNKVDGRPEFRRYLETAKGQPIQDVIVDIDPINSMAKERLGYPTQKPPALLERIIEASSEENDVILDPFCGCGTTIHAAQKLRRQWIGIDVTHLAITLIEHRLKDAFPGITFQVHGTPKDIDGARALADQDKYQFQWWAVSLVNAVPYGGKKKGADSGIDGLIYFKPDGKTTEKAIVSVKGGTNVNVAMIRDLGHVIEREKAKVGIFITLTPPTGPMRVEAVKMGEYETPYGKYPKLQILTIAELFDGKRARIPLIENVFRKPEVESMQRQANLL